MIKHCCRNTNLLHMSQLLIFKGGNSIFQKASKLSNASKYWVEYMPHVEKDIVTHPCTNEEPCDKWMGNDFLLNWIYIKLHSQSFGCCQIMNLQLVKHVLFFFLFLTRGKDLLPPKKNVTIVRVLWITKRLTQRSIWF